MPTPTARVVEPPPRSLLSLRLGEDGPPLGSRLRGTRDGALLVDAPVDEDDAPAVAEPLQEVVVSWAGYDGVNRAPAVVVDPAAPPVDGVPGPLWLVRITGEPEIAQRREYFRGRAAGTLALAAGADEVPARILDLSEGGLRCRVKGPAPAPQGGTVTASLTLDDAAIVTDAEVVRSRPSLDGRVELGLRFLDLPERSGDAIRRHLFQQQLRERRNGMA